MRTFQSELMKHSLKEKMRQIFSFAYKPRRAPARRGQILVLDPTTCQAQIRCHDNSQMIVASVDIRDCHVNLLNISVHGSPIVVIECDVSGQIITHMHIMVNNALIDDALQRGGWKLEYDLITLAKLVWREAIVPAITVRSTTVEEKLLCNALWNENFELFPHQRETITWLLSMERAIPIKVQYDGNIKVSDKWYIDTENECYSEENSIREVQLRGGLCCDGMGKGKTASILFMISCSNKIPTLLILPVNIVSQWQEEILKFLSRDFQVINILSGKDAKHTTKEDLLNANLVITTFQFLKSNKTYMDLVENALDGQPRERAALAAWERQSEKNECVLEGITWGRLIVDEIHHVFELSQDLKHLRLFRSKIIWGLTATPHLNNEKAQHLYALLCREKAHHPNMLASLISAAVWMPENDFFTENRIVRKTRLTAEERMSLDIRDNDRINDQVKKINHLKSKTEHANDQIEVLKSQLTCHIRSVRVMERVQVEMEKEMNETENLSNEQKQKLREGYLLHMDDLRAAMQLKEKCQERLTAQENSMQRLNNLQSSNMCNFCKNISSSHILNPCNHIFCTTCVPETVCSICGELIHEKYAITGSGMGSKIKEMVETIVSFGETEPILLFVQWKSMMRITKINLQDFGIVVHTLEGNAQQRARTLATFVRGGVLLLCLEDGFAGLNLPHVAYVIFAHAIVGDRENVQMLEQQAIARCERFGQTRTVKSFSFLVSESAEEHVYHQTR